MKAAVAHLGHDSSTGRAAHAYLLMCTIEQGDTSARPCESARTVALLISRSACAHIRSSQKESEGEGATKPCLLQLLKHLSQLQLFSIELQRQTTTEEKDVQEMK